MTGQGKHVGSQESRGTGEGAECLVPGVAPASPARSRCVHATTYHGICGREALPGLDLCQRCWEDLHNERGGEEWEDDDE